MANIDEPRAPTAGKDEAKDDPDSRNADSDFDDLIIEVDDSEVASEESTGESPQKKY